MIGFSCPSEYVGYADYNDINEGMDVIIMNVI